jgi:hypothetical protein
MRLNRAAPPQSPPPGFTSASIFLVCGDRLPLRAVAPVALQPLTSLNAWRLDGLAVKRVLPAPVRRASRHAGAACRRISAKSNGLRCPTFAPQIMA